MALTGYYDAQSVADSTNPDTGREVRLESDTESSTKSTIASNGKDIQMESGTESSTKSASAANPSNKGKGIETLSDTESITKSTGSLDFSNIGNDEDTESITEFTRAIGLSEKTKKKPIPIGVAILGAGPCVRTKYLPAIERACGSYYLEAVYSRSKKNARKLADAANIIALTSNVTAYYDIPPSSNNLNALLEREDIQAVVIAVHPSVQPDIIKKALEAGKHVLSERPIGKDLKTAKSLVEWYNKQNWKEPRIWDVALNVPCFKAMDYGFNRAKEIGGRVIAFSLTFYNIVPPVGAHGGEYLRNFALRSIAGLRTLLTAFDERVTNIAAFTSLSKEHLAPRDTIHAIMQLSNGHCGTFTFSIGTEFWNKLEIRIHTENGTVVVYPDRVYVQRTEESKPKEKLVDTRDGIDEDVLAFEQSIRRGYSLVNPLTDKGLGDLIIFESLLESADDGEVLNMG